jgi:hypothetical protein
MKDEPTRRGVIGGLAVAAAASRTAAAGPVRETAVADATRSAPGTLIRSQRDKNERDQIPLLDFCSGSAADDATPGFAKAITKVLELNADLLIPAGDYRLTDTARIFLARPEPFRSFNIHGMGSGSHLVWDGGSHKPMLHISGTRGTGWYSKCRLENFRLNGNSFTGDPFAGVTGIQLGNTPEDGRSGVCNASFYGLVIQHVAKGIHAFYESDEVTVFDNYIERFTDYGVYNQHGGGNWTLLANHISDGGSASTGIRGSLSCTRAIGNTIQGTQFRVGIQIDGGRSMRGQSPYIVSNYIECLLDHVCAIALLGVDGGLVEANIFKGCRGATLVRLGDSADGMPCRNVQIGPHMHHVSGGWLASFASCSPTASNCAITGHLESLQDDGTPGRYGAAPIEGPFIETFQNGERAPRAINVGGGALKAASGNPRAEFGSHPQPDVDLARTLGATDRRWNNALVQRLSLIEGVKRPAPVTGHAQLFVDAADGQLKIVLSDGTIRTIVTRP